MPKIIIREIDNTSTGTVEYSNFSVVVPGVLGTPTSQEVVFDDNGVYECSNQKDFIKYIGKTKKITGGSCATYLDVGTVTKVIYDKYLPTHQVYTFSVITDETKKVPGKGRIHNAAGWFELSAEPIAEGTAYDATKPYVIITNIGSDSVEQNGNQIAYELVGMGYTVLFKKVNSDTVGPELENADFWECLKDKSTYDFRYICTGGYTSITAYKHICEIANHVNETTEKLEDETIPGRGDCIALIDADETGFSQSTLTKNVQDYVNSLASGTDSILNKYAAVFCPKVIYAETKDAIYDNLTFPASFHYLACAAYARNELRFNEWYAVAGYTRGVCDKTVEKTTFKFGEIEINALQPRKSTYDKATGKGTKYSVNVIATIRKNYYLWGNRTAYLLNDKDLKASHFLNIRQLCTTIKKDVWVACRELQFNPNSDLLWGEFCNKVRPTLEKMKADQGIADYKIIKVKDTRKAILTAKIRIVPIEAVEDFDISIYLEDSISGVNVTAAED